MPEPDGYLLLRNTGCIACHSLDGTKLVGPSFKGLFGQERMVCRKQQGQSQPMNNTLQNQFMILMLKLLQGYNKGLMKSYKEVIKESDIKIIIDYLKTLAGEKIITSGSFQFILV